MKTIIQRLFLIISLLVGFGSEIYAEEDTTVNSIIQEFSPNNQKILKKKPLLKDIEKTENVIVTLIKGP